MYIIYKEVYIVSIILDFDDLKELKCFDFCKVVSFKF